MKTFDAAYADRDRLKLGALTMHFDVRARLLYRVMSELSEGHYCARWLIGNEYKLWADLTGKGEVRGERAYGISREEKEELQLVHELSGGWIRWSDDAKDLVFLTTEEWLSHLAQLEAPTELVSPAFRTIEAS